MIRALDRKVVMLMVRLRLWRPEIGLFHTVEIRTGPRTRWLLDWMKRRQRVGTEKHAPCCPANHWHQKRLVFHRCNCGAVPRGVAIPQTPKENDRG